MGNRSTPEGLRICLLGGFSVSAGSNAIDDATWRLRKARNIIKLLTLAPSHRLHREQVISALWPELAPEPALNNLHQTLHIARRALSLALVAREGMNRASNGAAGELASSLLGVLHIRDHIVTLNLPLWVDVEAFEQAAARASGTADISEHEAAIRLHTGELLPEDRYEDWTFERREALARRYLALLSELAQLYEQARDLPRAAESFRRVLAADPAHEEAHIGLMRLYALMGQRQEALRQFHDLRNALKEIDADPQPASVELHKAILSGDLAKLTSSASRPSTGPERPHVRPLRGVEAAKRERPGNLPAPLTTFIGRERELAVLKDLLAETRLLTLTGPGGSGKTRLGLELAAALRDRFPDGVWWVDLQALQEPTQVSQAVAATLGVSEQPGQSLETVLANWLRRHHLLLVLDNCEHLLSGCAALAEALLGACPHVRILTTSRERLGVPGEGRWPVPPLAVPPKNSRLAPEELRTFEAVRLFETRSRAVNPGFALNASNAATVADICRRLDGLPLAIELAAARTHMLSVEQILQRLQDHFALLTIPGKAGPRYRTLAEAIDWSYRLLSEPERALFRRLAVFAGGFTLEAAQAICAAAPVEAERTLDLLASLVDKSLVTVEERPDGTVRYRLLETIREYAREKLLESGEEAETRGRHRDWYLALAERADPEFGGPRRRVWLDRLESEHDNVRAALAWSTTVHGDAQAALRLAAALRWFWYMKGHVREGRRWLERAEHAEEGVSAAVRARALNMAGMLAWRESDLERAETLLRDALALAKKVGDKSEIALALHHSAHIEETRGDYQAATALFEESVAIYREAKDTFGLGLALSAFGDTRRSVGDYERALQLYTEGMMLLEAVYGFVPGDSLLRLGVLARIQGDYNRASGLLHRALATYQKIVSGNQWLIAWALVHIGAVAGAQAKAERAVRLYGAAEGLREAVGVAVAPTDRADYDQNVASARAMLGEKAFDAAWAEGRAMTLEQAIEYALSETSEGGS